MNHTEEQFADEELIALSNLTKDLKEASKKLTRSDVRYLVKMYYRIQNYRIRANKQLDSRKNIEKNSENAPVVEENKFVELMFESNKKFENVIKKALDIYTMEYPIGQWLRSIIGIGPVIAAGLLAHIDIRHYNKNKGESEGAIYPSDIWRYAGLDPTCVWKTGEKLPWNKDLKVLCWKLGESFVKTQNHKDSFYGKIYKERRKYEDERNASGKNADAAQKQLTSKKYVRDTIAKRAYLEGKLPDGHVYARARRFVVKMFLSHMWEVWYEIEFKRKPSKPWIFAIGGHGTEHYIAPPNWNNQVKE